VAKEAAISGGWHLNDPWSGLVRARLPHHSGGMIERLPWLRRLKKSDPEPPLRLPLPIRARGWRARQIRALVLERAEAVSRREGIDRREFLASACGMAATLQAINLVSGCGQGRSGASPMAAGAADAGAPPLAGRVDGPVAGQAGVAGAAQAPVTGGGAEATPAAADAAPAGGPADAGFAVPDDAMVDPEAARCLMGIGVAGSIVDVQLRIITPEVGPVRVLPIPDLSDDPPWFVRTAGCGRLACFDRDELIDQVFLGSETRGGVISGLPYQLGSDGTGGASAPILNEDLHDIVLFLRRRLEQDGVAVAVLAQSAVMPNDRIDLQLEMMASAPQDAAGWTLHTAWAPPSASERGYWLDGDAGQRVLARGLELGRPIFWVHKGVIREFDDPVYIGPRDVGPAARMFPEAHIVVYHAAFEHGFDFGESSRPPDDAGVDLGWGAGVGMWPEGPYDENDAAVQALFPLDRGVNSLIRSLRQSNIGPNGVALDGSVQALTHVYADCGHAWPHLMMGRVDEAMHFFGKLLLHVGEDRVLWGSGSVFTGNPTPFIEAFRAFQISEQFQQRFGYPALTAERKQKILSGNALRLLSLLPEANVGPCERDAG